MIAITTYIQRRTASLRALDQEIARLTRHACLAPGEFAPHVFDAIEGLQATRENATIRLQELRTGGTDNGNFDEAMSNVEEAWDEMRTAVLAAISSTYFNPEVRTPAR